MTFNTKFDTITVVIDMFSIKNDTENTIIIKNSKFICILYKVYEIEKIDKYLTQTKEKYKNATHYCYAYIINNQYKYSDDQEPSSTAGPPIYETLKNKNLNNILCVVVRYYGGIKLGASGLIRAYSKSTKEAINKATLVKLIKAKNVNITFDYKNIKLINNLLKENEIIKKEYNQNITYNVNIENELINKLNNISKITINNDIYIEK